MQAEKKAARSAQWIPWALMGLIVVGFAARGWGITFGLPYLYHPDEPVGVGVAVNIFKTGDLNPHSFGYGSLFFYLNALAYVPYYFVGQLAGVFHSPNDIPQLQSLALGVGQALMPTQMILGRLVSVVAGTLCIPFAYWLGTRLSGRGTGLLAATLVALSPTLVLHSQYITPNILVTLMTLVTLATLIRLAPESRWPAYVLVGIAFGAAIASKYNAVFLATACAMAYVALWGRSMLRRPGVYVSALATVATFFVLTPYAILDNAKFMEDAVFHVTAYGTVRHAGLEGDTLQFYLNLLISREGWLIFLAFSAMSVYVIRRNRIGLIMTAFTMPYLIYISTLWLRTDYTLMLAMPVLMIMAAGMVGMIWRRLGTIRANQLGSIGRGVVIVFVAGSIGYLMLRTVQLNIRQTTIDGREYARRWIEADVPAGARIAAESYAPFIDPVRYNVKYFNNLISEPPDWYATQNYDWLVASSNLYGRFYREPDLYSSEIASYDALFARYPEAASFDQNGITIRIFKVKR